jgi:hypothetical protein
VLQDRMNQAYDLWKVELGKPENQKYIDPASTG